MNQEDGHSSNLAKISNSAKSLVKSAFGGKKHEEESPESLETAVSSPRNGHYVTVALSGRFDLYQRHLGGLHWPAVSDYSKDLISPSVDIWDHVIRIVLFWRIAKASRVLPCRALLTHFLGLQCGTGADLRKKKFNVLIPEQFFSKLSAETAKSGSATVLSSSHGILKLEYIAAGSKGLGNSEGIVFIDEDASEEYFRSLPCGHDYDDFDF